jgi:hypothetical protein
MGTATTFWRRPLSRWLVAAAPAIGIWLVPTLLYILDGSREMTTFQRWAHGATAVLSLVVFTVGVVRTRRMWRDGRP